MLLLFEPEPESDYGADYGGEKGKRRARKQALRMLERRSRGGVRASWGGSGSATRVDEEMGMSGARGSSVVFDRMKVTHGEGEGKKPFWSLKRWM